MKEEANALEKEFIQGLENARDILNQSAGIGKIIDFNSTKGMSLRIVMIFMITIVVLFILTFLQIIPQTTAMIAGTGFAASCLIIIALIIKFTLPAVIALEENVQDALIQIYRSEHACIQMELLIKKEQQEKKEK